MHTLVAQQALLAAQLNDKQNPKNRNKRRKTPTASQQTKDMDKTFFEELATRHNVSSDIAKQICLDICKEMARRLASNEKQSNPYFTVKPVNRAEKSKLSSDGSRQTIEARFFGRMILKGIAAAQDKQAGG